MQYPCDKPFQLTPWSDRDLLQGQSLFLFVFFFVALEPYFSVFACPNSKNKFSSQFYEHLENGVENSLPKFTYFAMNQVAL